MLRSTLFLLLLAGSLLASPRDRDHDLPLTPGEFHAQEAARLLQGLQRMSRHLDEDQADYDVHYYELAIDLRDFYGQTITGEVSIHAAAQLAGFDEVRLDLCSDLTVDSILYNGSSLPFTHSNHELIVPLPAGLPAGNQFVLTVHYHGTPCLNNGSNTFDYWNRPTPNGNIPSISTLSEPYGSRDWWPCKDTPSDKADSARISLTVADTLVATSNGVLESVTPLAPASHTWTWFESNPIAVYLICLAATNYAEWSDWYVAPGGDSLPIVNYTYPEKLSQSLESWNVIPDILGFFETIFGEFPFRDEKYGHTMFPFGGAMEHQCNTFYGDGITNGNHFYDWIVAHEAAHQYWGNDVTLHTWPDIWLNEGFASYSEALWEEHVDGFDAYKNYMVTGLSVFDPSGPIYDPSALFDANTVYDKGGWILHMLRGVLRDDSLFFEALREYRARHAYSTATTDELFMALNDVVGFDIEPYVHAYLYRTNRPHFESSFGTDLLDGRPRTAVRITQTQTNPDTTFRTRLELDFSGPQDTTVIVENSQWEEVYHFDFGFTPTTLNFDPDNWVLKEHSATALSPVILNTELPDALELEAYNDTLVAIGGTAPYSFELTSGALPGGLSLRIDGPLTGAPIEYGDFSFTVTVTDDNDDTVVRDFELHVQGLPRVPQELTCIVSSPDTVTFHWQSAENTLHYELYHSSSPELTSPELITTTSDTTFSEPLRSPGHHFYHVTSVALP